MKRSDSIEYLIGTHYLSAIINQDYTGLSEEEEGALEEFEYQVLCDTPAGYEFGHFSPSDTEAEFGFCEVCGLMASVVPVTAIYWSKEA